MKSRQAMRALAGILLCGLGLWLALPTPYRERTYIFKAEGCRLETTIVEKQVGGGQGSVLLFHGISANKKIMLYFARGFAEQGLRVYVPDLPGHGRTPGRFSPARVEQCGEALLHELLAREMISADRTILAGHSMGGAIAERIAARVPVAGLIAISPAPMRAAHGLTAEKLLFSDPPELPPHSLVIVGSLELESMRGNAADLVAARNDAPMSYVEIRGATHVSVLFSGAAMRSAQEWAARVLNLHPTAAEKGVGVPRLLLEFAAGSVLSVFLLRYWNPLKAIGLFQGDYLASVVLLFGALLIALHWSAVRKAFTNSSRHLLAAGFAGIVLLLLTTAWCDLTFYEAWLTRAKWMRFPILLMVFFPYLLAEETLLGTMQPGKRLRRLVLALTLRLITWGAMMGGVLFLHNGE